MTSLRSIMVGGLVAVLGAGSALALSACSDDNVFGDGNHKVSVKLTERDLDPGRVDVDAGTIDFEVQNDGDRVHGFAVRTPDGVERITEIKPGDTETLTVDLPVGRYRMYDPRGGYRLRGVSGTVVVTDDDTDTVTERTVERTVVDEEPVVTAPETDEPEIQEPEIQEPPPAPQPPQAPPPPPVVTQTVPAPPPPAETTP